MSATAQRDFDHFAILDRLDHTIEARFYCELHDEWITQAEAATHEICGRLVICSF